MNVSFSVIVPLYNKEAEIERTIRSALAQTYPPLEIVVVDDGSTDRSAALVEAFGSPLVRLVRQPNAGECAARNRAIAQSRGDVCALLDADDAWHPEFLAEIAGLIVEFPGCGLYATAFDVVSDDGVFPGNSYPRRGVVDDFFADSMRWMVCIPSASAVPRAVFDRVGGFPEGMRLAGDQYMWTKIASQYRICCSPRRLCDYSRVASNRSSAIYTPERTAYSFRTFYDPAWPARNEYLARVELGKALVISSKGGTAEGRDTERFYRFTRCNRRAWRKLWILNRLPRRWRPRLFAAYNRLAWKLARKGL